MRRLRSGQLARAAFPRCLCEAADGGGSSTRRMKNKQSSAPVGGRSRWWSWQHYLHQQNAQAAPLALFTQSQGFPAHRSAFKVGMKLEGIDPLHPNMFCVMTVAEAMGCRLRVHFDGYSKCHDFWLNSDSADIRPAGWCGDNRRRLHPPKGWGEQDFDWSQYLQSTGAQAAPPSLFACRAASCGFRVGMKLEAVDRKNPGLVCVASVADVVDDRILVHFDNWDHSYDYWCESGSPLIRPVGWCEEHGRPLTAPHAHPDPENFTWEEYLREGACEAAPASAFATSAPRGFAVGHRLEAVDKRNPVLIRVATITATEGYRVKVHYDGWSHHFDVWCDGDLADLHPVGWCQRTGHPLEVPPGRRDSPSRSQDACPTSGCRGAGHIKGPKYSGHHSAFGCPYSDTNMRKELLLPDRLGGVAARGPGRRSLGRDSTQVKMEAPNALLPPVVKRRRMADRLLRKPPALLPLQVEDEKPRGQARAPGLLCPPARERSPSWEQQRKLLPGVTRVHADAVRRWSVRQVCAFVESLRGCEDLAQQFGDEQIDGRAFLLLTQRDILRIMSIKLGPALKIYNSILMLKHEECSKGDAASSHPAGKKRSRDEEQKPSANEDDNQARDADGGDGKNRTPGENARPARDPDQNRSGHGDEEEKHASDEEQSCDRERARSSHDVEKQRVADTRVGEDKEAVSRHQARKDVALELR